MAASCASSSLLLRPSMLRSTIPWEVASSPRQESVAMRAAIVPGPPSANETWGSGAVDGDDEGEWEEIPVHRVTVRDRQKGVTHSFWVPEDRYILQTGEEQQIDLPFSCRHGCCTACAVRVKSGQLYQPQALGISAELREKGYGLLCVGYPLSDIEVETQDEDEDRDDFALELAVADE
uniref:2Fe-2S ferredoxin-type domain-containing protein n=1 Tax=Physcomitrium patens TaxID=3218 RepID=A0A7I4BE04_PHYPA